MKKKKTIPYVSDSPVADRLASAGGEVSGEAALNYSYGVSSFDGAIRDRTPPEEKETYLRRFLDPESGLDEEKSSTERVRKYYKNNKKKVREYLKKTQDDRVARNRDRRKAVKKHGKTKMKNHDVHHPNGPKNGNWRLAKKDHGRDKVNENSMLTENDINAFTNYVCSTLKINNVPSVEIIDPSPNMASLGAYEPSTNIIRIVIKGRLLADILRTLAHELYHAKQNQDGRIRSAVLDGGDGSDIENEANAAAGVLMRKYGRENKHIYLQENKSTVLCAKCLWRWNLSDAGADPYRCHNCWYDNSPQYLIEGGAGGHMMHPYEDDDLKFSDMDTMIERGLTGNLGEEAPVSEKLDGMNIAFTVSDDGQVRFARNKGQLKNRGSAALDAEGVAEKFKEHEASVRTAFTEAAADLEQAVSKLSPEQISEMFGGGSKFVSLEIVHPDSQNVIPYDKAVLVFHETIEYDEDGNEISRSPENGRKLADMITSVNAQEQKTFGIEGPRTMAFSDEESEKNQELADRFSRRLERLREEYGLDENSTIADYKRAWWERRIDSMQTDFEWTAEEREGLIQRWAFDNKSALKLTAIKDPAKKQFIRDYESGELKADRKQAIRPLEQTFLQVGVRVLSRVTNFMASNNPAAAEKLKQEVRDSVERIKDAGYDEQVDLLQKELERLGEVGIDDMVPSEGVVFTFGGRTYKFTGAFAPINQINGILKFGRGAPKQAETDDVKSTPSETPPPELPPEEKPTQSTTGLNIPPGWEGLGWEDEELPAEPEDVPVEPEDASLETPDEPDEPQVDTGTESPTDTEDQPDATERRTVAVLPGRFQPFHPGHYSAYKALVDQFGAENVYIATSDKVDPVTSPMDFNERKRVITTFFPDIPEENIIQAKNPMSPVELTETLPPDTVVVVGLSEKDAERGRGKYFSDYDPNGEHLGYGEAGYITVLPELQIQVDGQNISGTQLRAALGDPGITDRAKEELFTKVYGSFDRDSFDLIVKRATSAEENRKVADAYADAQEKQGAKRKKKATEDQVQKVRDSGVLQQQVYNDETDNWILVGSALRSTYDGTKVQDEARKMVQQVLMQQQEVITEEKKEKKEKKSSSNEKLQLYLHTRDYTNQELIDAVDEYFKNERTFKLFPKLAKDRVTLREKIVDAPTIVLTKYELEALGNSEVPEILQSDNKAKELKRIEKEYGRDPRGILSAIKNEEELPLPIVIAYKNGHYLLGGNTRLSVLASVNHTMPVAVLDYAEDVAIDIAPETDQPDALKNVSRQDRKKKFDSVLNMTLTNPETGNQVKVDTAMDYKKTHPAHKIALNLIRQQMAGYSSRAGIPKNKRS